MTTSTEIANIVPSRIKRPVCGEEFFDNLIGSIMQREQPRRFIIGNGPFSNVNVCRGRIITVGGFIGAGKTALTMQWIVHALQADAGLRVLVNNVETDQETLVERQIARIAGVSADVVHERRYAETDDDTKDRIWQASLAIRELMPRIYFCRPGTTTADLREYAAEFGTELLLVDFIQKVKPEGNHSLEETSRVQAVMEDLVEMKRNGLTIIALSAVRRGASPDDAPSFRGSSDIEFLSDECYVLETTKTPNGDGLREARLRHQKSRFRQMTDINLWFDGMHQHFIPMEVQGE